MTNVDTQARPRTWFITGVSSGFGRALADAALAQGDQVVGSVRQAAQIVEFEQRVPGRARAVQLDLTTPEAVHDGVAAALAAFGQIDVLVNNAGYALLSAVEEASDADIRQQMETNFFGAVAIMQAVLPHMRERRHGHIVNVSSVGGFVGGPGWGFYCASKFALEGLSDCLAMEVAPLGIKVTIVEPGAFRTNLGVTGTSTGGTTIDDYAATVGQTRAWRAGSSGQESGDPIKAAQAILQAVGAPEPPLRLVLGADALESVRGKLAAMTAELDAWESVTRATAYIDEE